MMKIDFVLPWVNPNDIEWQKNKHMHANSNQLFDEKNDSFRYRDFETLKYVLRSIEFNCPWYNKIYLITEGHSPEWLNLSNDKIKLVTHKDVYFNKKNLPIFNSSSIEMNILNIPNLSEHFVYLNDDTIILNKLDQSRFFINNLPVDFISHKLLPRGKIYKLLKGNDSWINALNNNLRLVNKNINLKNLTKEQLFNKSYPLSNKVTNLLLRYIFKKFFWLEHWHHPQAYCKQTLVDVYNLFKNEMANCSKNKFRDHSDLTHYLYRYHHLSTGKFHPIKCNDALTKNIDNFTSLKKAIHELETKNSINFICFNDSDLLPENEYLKVKNLINEFLTKKFPLKASFEN